MSESFSPVWFETPDGATLYALEAPDRIVEHRRLGRRCMRHVLEIRTFADRLHLEALLGQLEGGGLRALDGDAYAARLRNMERLEPWGDPGK